jgi:DNA replication protein DnaC
MKMTSATTKSHKRASCSFDSDIDACLAYLGMDNLRQRRGEYLRDAAAQKHSYQHLLHTIIADEYQYQLERRRQARIKAAAVPELLVMQTFPFERQPHLKKKLVMELYDSLRYVSENQVLLFIGPTGCGKTGLATAYLLHAIDNQYRGRFVDFKDLLRQLRCSQADYSEKRLLRHYSAIDCLLIDEVGYTSLDKREAGLFFDLMKLRHKKRCTILTSQLGFDEWGSFINDRHLTAALLDRITENCAVFNMSKCISIRQKKIAYAAEKSPDK